jgi:hypothetical protein
MGVANSRCNVHAMLVRRIVTTRLALLAFDTVAKTACRLDDTFAELFT